MLDDLNIRHLGDSAIVIEFGDDISPVTNTRALNAFEQISALKPRGFIYGIPSYASLTLVYDADTTTSVELLESVADILVGATNDEQPGVLGKRILTIPVCYNEEFGYDLYHVASAWGVSINELIEIHSRQTYRVYCLGFLPGFPYMGTLPDGYTIGRKPTPRMHIPAGSVGIAGNQTGIYPLDSPGGWQIIGKTPLQVINAESDDPFLFRPGDEVRFEPIASGRFYEISREVQHGNYHVNMDHE